MASLKVPRPDVVVATSPQFFCAVAGFLVSRLKRCPFVFELRDLWPESIVSVGAMKPGFAVRILEKIELFLYRKSARIVALTESFRENLVRRGIPRSKISVIPNGADFSLFRPRPAPETLIRELDAEDKFIVSYIGTVGMAHALDRMVELVERFEDEPDILFLIIGEGAHKKRIKELIIRKKLSNIRVLSGVPKEEVADCYALSALILISLRDTPLFRTVLPSKMFEAMAMSRPLLCAVDGECRRVVESADCGIFVEPENVGQMFEAIRELRQNKNRLSLMGRNGRSFAESHFHRDRLAQEYLSFLLRIFRSPDHPTA